MLSKENLLEIVNISVDAGEVILNYYNENVDVIYKDDESPLTKADLAELSEEHPGLFKELELSVSQRTVD